MPALASEIRAHRRDLTALTDTAASDIAVMFRRFDTAEAARDGLMDLLPRLISVYGSAAVSLAADWYDDLRDAAAPPGRFTAIPADLPGRERTDVLARWAVSPLYGGSGASVAQSLVIGGLQRLIANADRQTVMVSSVADRGAKGWARAGTGQCDFCQMLIGRGAVYTEASADFRSHDHCGCVAVPSFD